MNIQKIAYELYKQNWVDTHTTREMRLETIREYFHYCKESEDGHLAFIDWLEDVGYGSGSLYVCFEEFLRAEYEDVGYMQYLLKEKELFDAYADDVLKDSIDYLSQYISVTDNVKRCIVNHVQSYRVKPDVCAWYKDLQDFYSDWCSLGYTTEEATKLLHRGDGEFMYLPHELGIIRFTI